MSYKKHERDSEHYNEFEHAKIIAIVDKDGEIQSYDWTLTQNANDFFADPEDRNKYAAITVRPVTCESMAELQEKFRVALEYLRLGAALVTPKAVEMMKSLKEHRGSVEWMNGVNDCGMMSPLGIPQRTYVSHRLKVSPRARGKFVDFAYETAAEDEPSLRVVNELKEAAYKLGDSIQLSIVPAEILKGCERRRKVWVTVVACHSSMWTKDEEVDYFLQHEFIGKREGDGWLIQFNPKHVIQHVSCAKPEPESSDESGHSDSDDEPLRKVIKLTFEQTDENLLRLRTWINSDPISESESESDDEQRQRWAEFFKSGQCDRSVRQTGPALEPSGEAEQEQQAPPPEYIVPPPAPKLLRSRRRLPGWKSRR